MDYSTTNIVWAQSLIDAMLGTLDVLPTAVLIASPKLHLSKDPAVTITPHSVSATLAQNESTFSGYTVGGIVSSLSAVAAPGPNVRARLVSHLFLRTAGTPDVGELVYAWWLDGTAGFAAGEVLANPVDLTAVGSYLNLLAILALPTQFAL
jgi:hypothetical protein